jgi:citrate lyase beta subunit
MVAVTGAPSEVALPRSRTTSADAFVLTLWTADVALAREADAAGVDRIGIDLERLGKAERQHGLGTWISPHAEDDLDRIGAVLDGAALFARVNPLHGGSRSEVDRVLTRGVRVVMLPMVADAREAATFVDLVAGRARVVLLVECAEALRHLDDLVAVAGVDEVHIGLNDLALSLGLTSRWLALAGDLATAAGERVRAAGLRFGLGGIGRVDQGGLPVPADLVYAQYARTGATAALLSRSFAAADGIDLGDEVARARSRLEWWRERPAAELAAAHDELGRHARATACW